MFLNQSVILIWLIDKTKIKIVCVEFNSGHYYAPNAKINFLIYQLKLINFHSGENKYTTLYIFTAIYSYFN